jgi:hypothetical protein
MGKRGEVGKIRMRGEEGREGRLLPLMSLEVHVR